ncbi:MAG: PH domain-containing protein, partial [Anaerolineales bacterium]|nr:PH domain-containing protein [Anaerolineales bacterium]
YLVFDYYNDKYVLTNRRVVHDERHLLIYETRNEAPLRAVQNVQQVQEGVLAHLFGYGDLVIETAGERGQIVFHRIPDPQETQEVIFEQIMRVQTVDRATERAAIRDALQVRFGLQAVEPPPPDQATPPTAEKPGLTTTSLLKMLVGAFQFFVPPLVYREGDTITWRKHWVALLRPISLPTLGILVATAVALVVLYRGSPDLRASILAGYGVALMFLLPWWLWRFTDWRNDVYQLTASRIVDVERRPFFLREERREANLSMIQNINLEIPGIIGRIFNFGSITIETAGAGAFTFDYVRDPRSVQTEIFRRMEQFQQQQRQRAMQDRRAELLNWFSMYDQLRDSDK